MYPSKAKTRRRENAHTRKKEGSMRKKWGRAVTGINTRKGRNENSRLNL
jgi:hypothetical protein